MNLKELYEESIKASEKRIIIANNFSEKPTITSGIISPDSDVEVSMLGHRFFVDKEGMQKIIELFEKKWESESNKGNLMNVLVDIYNTTNNFLGGDGDENTRKRAYWDAGSDGLTVSQMEGKRIGQCIERSAIGHQLLLLLKQAGIINYESSLINSKMSSEKGEEMGPHSFIILSHQKDSSKKFLFDIENPRIYIPSESIGPTRGIGLYPLTEAEYTAFLDGKIISPQSVYEAHGMKIEGERFMFGSGDEMYKKKETVEIE